MGLAVSARQMIDFARSATKTETEDEANSFCTDPELLAVLNCELAELEDVIREVEDDDYVAGIHPITLIVGTTLYPLPVEGYKVRSVDVQWQPGMRRSAHRFMEADRNRFQSVAPAWSHFGSVYFRTLGDNIEIIPTPQTAVQIYVNYTPSFTPLTAYTDPYNSQNLWHMAAVYGLCAYIAMADNDLERGAYWESKKQAQLDRVRAMAANRVTGEPATIQRVRNRDEWED